MMQQQLPASQQFRAQSGMLSSTTAPLPYMGGVTRGVEVAMDPLTRRQPAYPTPLQTQTQTQSQTQSAAMEPVHMTGQGLP